MQKHSYNWLEEKINFMWLIEEAIKQGYEIRQWKAPQQVDNDDWPIHEIWDPKTQQGLTIGRINRYPDLSESNGKITKDKWVTQKILTDLGLPFPETHSFGSLEELKTPNNREKEWVIKPRSAGLGVDVYFPKNEEEIIAAAKKVLENHSRGLLQEKIDGKELRIQVIGGKFYAACFKVPAFITGNGEHTVQELIDEKNSAKVPHNRLIPDDEVHRHLLELNLSLDTIIEADRHLQLREVSNICLGGDPVDITNSIHPSYHEWVERIATRLKLKTFAVDVLAKNEVLSPEEANAKLIEVNAPCMWAHHNFALGQGRNTALALLDSYFHPESFDPQDSKYLT